MSIFTLSNLSGDEAKPNGKKSLVFYRMQLQLIVTMLLQPIRGILWVLESALAFQVLEGTTSGAEKKL